ncbi:MAG: single-stranded DNA-binding protein [Clostridia bacterium]|nr:single-stranded DNA-binding protein [Clostridia bacterium]
MMNKVVLIGNLTRDPELQTTTSGVSVCRFSLAVTRRFANNEGERDADFINIVVWRNQAENCHKYLKKGSKCAVVGRIQTSSYDAQDGSKRYTTDVVADEVEFISTTRSNGEGDFSYEASESRPSSKKETAELEEIDDDSLPF